MLDWNPSHHTRHAWEQTATVYGKIGLVLFYSLIWVLIISNAVSVLVPSSQGAQCLVSAAGKHHEVPFQALIRALSVMWIGFLSYADVGGLKVKNVAMVTIFVFLFYCAWLPVAQFSRDAGCGGYMMRTWIVSGWAVLALLFTIVEDKKKEEQGTAEETQNLTT